MLTTFKTRHKFETKKQSLSNYIPVCLHCSVLFCYSQMNRGTEIQIKTYFILQKLINRRASRRGLAIPLSSATNTQPITPSVIVWCCTLQPPAPRYHRQSLPCSIKHCHTLPTVNCNISRFTHCNWTVDK